MHCIVDQYHLLRGLLSASCQLASCDTSLGRVELDDDVTVAAFGLVVDAYGDECGEWVSKKGVRMNLKLGKDSPVSCRYPCNSYFTQVSNRMRLSFDACAR